MPMTPDRMVFERSINLCRKLFRQGSRQRIGNHIDMMLHHRPGFFFAGVIFVLELGNLSHMMVNIRGKQTSDRVF